MIKATFSLPEEVCSFLDHPYAYRILEGRKTDKSALICEAIHLLEQFETRLTET